MPALAVPADRSRSRRSPARPSWTSGARARRRARAGARLAVPAALCCTLAAGCGSADTASQASPVIELAADADAGRSLQALLDTLDGPATIRLAPGRWVLEPVPYTDPACGNCQDPGETPAATRGLRLAGTGITLTGDPTDPAAVVIETGAGYGVLFDGCRDCGLAGLTVTGGTRDPDGRATSAAVVVRGGAVLVEDCAITDNLGDSAVVHGSTIAGVAGVAAREGADLTLRRCHIVRSSWDGVALYRGARATITDNVIDGVDAASGGRHGGGRGVGIGVTWDAEATIRGNRVTRYWKGIGAFVDARVDVRENVVEDVLTWGLAWWGPDGGRPRAVMRDNVVFGTGACGIIVDRAAPPAGDEDPGELVGNVFVQTGRNPAYDGGEPYCTQRPIARHAVPAGFEIEDNLVFDTRQPGEAPPEPELADREALAEATGPLVDRLTGHEALRGAAFFRYVRGDGHPKQVSGVDAVRSAVDSVVRLTGRFAVRSALRHALGNAVRFAASLDPRPAPLAAQTPPRPSVDGPVVEATVADLLAAQRDGRTTARALAEAHLARIEAYDDAGPSLNAIMLVNPRALEVADSLDDLLARTGELAGPLHGIPVLVKDNYDIVGLPTTAGSAVLAGVLPPDDAWQVARLREAGAVVLAKTTMAEFAFSPYETVGSSYAGYTFNPYALNRVPAGSSGGTAAGVAASFGVVGLGTDTGNSIRGPSSHTALVGLRPTLGLTSRDGIVPLYLDRDVGGPMTRTVEDAARLLDVIAGSDPADPWTAEADRRRPDTYLDALDAAGLRGARIGVVRQMAPADDTDPEVLERFEAALADLRAAGATVVDSVEIPEIDAISGPLWCRRFRTDIEAYLASLGESAPVRTLEDIIETGDAHVTIRDRLDFFADWQGPPDAEEDCIEAARNEETLRAGVRRAMAEAGVDALAYPSWRYPPRLVGDLSSPHGNNAPTLSPPTGFPAITVPMGFVHGGTLPVGLQLLGDAWTEPTLLRYAYAYEQATRHRRPPPITPPLPPR